MRLLAVRHGESEANRDRLVLGRSLGVPLTRTGLGQARQAAKQLAGLLEGEFALLSSDALRARQTAGVIGERLGVPVEITELLREQHLGEMEGRPVSELRAVPTPEGFDITEIAWGGGESVADVHARLRELVAWLAGRDDLPGTVVLVGHGDALCVLQAVLAGRGHREIDWTHDSMRLAEVRDLGQPRLDQIW